MVLLRHWVIELNWVITFWLTTIGLSVVCAPLMFAFIFSPHIYAEKFGNAVRNLGQD